jgi:signal peptidase
VLSGSMRPTLAPGDVVVVTPEPVGDVRPGQVITYAIPVGDHHVETHRVIRVSGRHQRPAVVTKGDANATPDPWVAVLTSPTAWRMRLVIPKAGWLIIWLDRPYVQHASLVAAPVVLAVLWLVAIWRPRPRKAPPAGMP